MGDGIEESGAVSPSASAATPSSPTYTLHGHEVDFSPGNSTAVVSDALKYILPVPNDRGEALVYPETVTDASGRVHEKGSPITDRQGKPLEGEGVVVYNSSEGIYQAGVAGKTGDARAVIIINHVTSEQAARLDEMVHSLTNGKPENLTLDQFKKVEAFARSEGLTNMYDSDVEFVKGKMQDPITGLGGDDAPAFGFKMRDGRDTAQAVFIQGPAQLQDEVGTPLPIGEEGAILLQQGDDVRVVSEQDFAATYRTADGFQPVDAGAIQPGTLNLQLPNEASVRDLGFALYEHGIEGHSFTRADDGTWRLNLPGDELLEDQVSLATALAEKAGAITSATHDPNHTWTITSGREGVGYYPVADEAMARQLTASLGETGMTQHSFNQSPDGRWYVEIPGDELERANMTTTKLHELANEARNQASDIPDNPLGASSKAAAGTHIAMGTVGVAVGTMGLVNSIKRGDTGGAVIAGGNVATGATQTTIQVLESAGHAIAPALKDVVAKANIAVTLADGAYQVYKEDELDHKVIRGASLGMTTALTVPVVATTTAATTAFLSGAAITGATATVATVAAPVIAAAGTAYAIKEIAEQDMVVIDGIQSVHETYKKAFAVEVDTKQYGNLLSYANPGFYATKDSPYLKDTTKDELGFIDLKNPENFPKLRAAIGDHSEKLHKVMDKHEPTLPMWADALPFTDHEGRAKYADAKIQAVRADAALIELDHLEKKTHEAEKHRPKERPETSLASLSPDVLERATQAVSKETIEFHDRAVEVNNNTDKVAQVPNNKGTDLHI